MRISDWSSDVCSSDLFALAQAESGADVLYAERAGVVDAAREKGIIAFGNVNDMNKAENGEDVVVASALWHMEPAIDHAIAQVNAGTFKAEDYREWTMMKAGGASDRKSTRLNPSP